MPNFYETLTKRQLKALVALAETTGDELVDIQMRGPNDADGIDDRTNVRLSGPFWSRTISWDDQYDDIGEVRVSQAKADIEAMPS